MMGERNVRCSRNIFTGTVSSYYDFNHVHVYVVSCFLVNKVKAKLKNCLISDFLCIKRNGSKSIFESVSVSLIKLLK